MEQSCPRTAFISVNYFYFHGRQHMCNKGLPNYVSSRLAVLLKREEDFFFSFHIVFPSNKEGEVCQLVWYQLLLSIHCNYLHLLHWKYSNLNFSLDMKEWKYSLSQSWQYILTNLSQWSEGWCFCLLSSHKRVAWT